MATETPAPKPLVPLEFEPHYNRNQVYVIPFEAGTISQAQRDQTLEWLQKRHVRATFMEVKSGA